ncbi:MAG: macro domain-containing protein, partial [Bacteroidetes bacterium]|nr:macro domain-containing protein [Bacteroidota bacterium]
NKQGGCQSGEAVITSGGNLPSRYVIHTVGPVWNGDNEEKKKLLANCYINSLQLAFNHGIKSIAFPNISIGIYHFPKDKAATIAIESIKSFKKIEAFDKIIFACFDEENLQIYQKLINKNI